MDYHIWAWFGTMYLIILTYQDFKHKCYVDDRYNYAMYGLTIGMMFIMKISIKLTFIMIGLLLLMQWLLKKFKIIGEADINSLFWMMWGFTLLGTMQMLIFLGVFISINSLFAFAKYLIEKINKVSKATIPYYPVLLGTFIIVCYIVKAY
jgi:hypothetical protein